MSRLLSTDTDEGRQLHQMFTGGPTMFVCSQLEFAVEATEAVVDRRALPASTELAYVLLKCQRRVDSLVTAAPVLLPDCTVVSSPMALTRLLSESSI